MSFLFLYLKETHILSLKNWANVMMAAIQNKCQCTIALLEIGRVLNEAWLYLNVVHHTTFFSFPFICTTFRQHFENIRKSLANGVKSLEKTL